MKQKICVCGHCGNLAAMLCDCGQPLCYCGEEMRPVRPGEREGSGEKHRPVYTQDGSTVHVTVGAMEHPMTPEHHIAWICLESERVVQYAALKPEDRPRADFALCPGDAVRAVYAFCNQHDIWRD